MMFRSRPKPLLSSGLPIARAAGLPIAFAAALPIVLAAGSLAAASPVQAGEAGTRYASWHGCLDRHFGLQAAIGSRPLAADAAIGACREPERAYLAALAASPLLDADDAQQARAALVARARARLLGRRAAL